MKYRTYDEYLDDQHDKRVRFLRNELDADPEIPYSLKTLEDMYEERQKERDRNEE